MTQEKINQDKTLVPGYNEKRSNNSLRMLGWLAIILGFTVVIVGNGIYEVEIFGSISASATFYGTSYLLPFAMGGMAVYFYGYNGYSIKDRFCAKVMSVAAIGTAVFPCKTPYNQCLDEVGILGVQPCFSDVLHTISAVVLFGTLCVWILLFFTKTDKRKKPTKGKKRRNKAYKIIGVIVALATVGFILQRLGVKLMADDFPHVWFWEVIVLIPAGIAILIKAEAMSIWFNNLPEKSQSQTDE